VLIAAVMVGWAACPVTARGQQQAVAFGQSAIFEPEIDVVNSGVLLDAQATVSPDLKYVTLNMRVDQSQLLALRTFQFQGAGNGPAVQLPGGAVGGVNPVIAGSVIPQGINAPMKVEAGKGGAILLKRGVTPLVME
jgi:hypothetical protein